MTRDRGELLIDALLSLEGWLGRAEEVARTLGRERVRSDFIAQLALAKAVEQCGEISARIMRRWPDFAADHPELELRLALDMRNRLVHGYDSIDMELLWIAATDSVPRMRARLLQILQGLRST